MRQYRFPSLLHWLQLRRRGFVGDEKKRMAGRLCDALVELYKPELWRIARSLAALSRLAERSGDAKRYQHMADFNGPADILRWRAQLVLESATADWDEWECERASELLLAAFEQLLYVVPVEEASEYVRQAYGLACRARNRKLQLQGLLAQTGWELYRNDLDASQEHAGAALAIAQEFPVDDHRCALALLRLGEIGVRRTTNNRGDFLDTQLGLESALSRLRQIGNRVGQAQAHKALGYLNLLRCNEADSYFAASLSHFQTSAEILKTLQEEPPVAPVEAVATVEVLLRLAQLHAAQGQRESAVEYYSDARELAVGEEFAFPGPALEFGNVAILLGDIEAARAHFTDAAELAERRHDHQAFAVAREKLARLAPASHPPNRGSSTGGRKVRFTRGW